MRMTYNRPRFLSRRRQLFKVKKKFFFLKKNTYDDINISYDPCIFFSRSVFCAFALDLIESTVSATSEQDKHMMDSCIDVY